MAINIANKIDKGLLEKVLKRKGWKEGKYNGSRAFLKENKNWIWIALVKEEKVSFISLPLQEESALHSKGVSHLLEEVQNIGEEVGFSVPLKI